MTAAASPNLLAAVVFESSETVGRVLCDFVASLTASKIRLAGFIQVSEETQTCGCPDTYVVDLETGTRTKILQDLGAESQGCRVNPAVIADVGQLVNAALSRAPQLLVINRFGKLESEGKGLRDEIASAALSNIPTLVAVSTRYLADWRLFVADLGSELPCEPEALNAWWRAITPELVPV